MGVNIWQWDSSKSSKSGDPGQGPGNEDPLPLPAREPGKVDSSCFSGQAPYSSSRALARGSGDQLSVLGIGPRRLRPASAP